MGKLPNRKYDFKADNGDVFTFHSEVTVTPDGIFHLSVPTELDEVGRLLAK
ncbi:MAG: hypothetical protein CSYNP_02806 [Syntrophus sp. SKADARSKE-3]|nr:hypothetical protein [Syntrophus sp. SKADARSKE-3]